MTAHKDPTVAEAKLRALGVTDTDLDNIRASGFSVLGAWSLFQKFLAVYKLAKESGVVDELLSLLGGIGKGLHGDDPQVLPHGQSPKGVK